MSTHSRKLTARRSIRLTGAALPLRFGYATPLGRTTLDITRHLPCAAAGPAHRHGVRRRILFIASGGDPLQLHTISPACIRCR